MTDKDLATAPAKKPSHPASASAAAPSHTPTPWVAQHIDEEHEPGLCFIVGSNLGGLVGAAMPWPTELDSGDFSRVEANAALIVKAVNERQQLVEALRAALATIEDYLAYKHGGDPWTEDARSMGEMDINDYARDGRLSRARAALTATEA